VRAVAAAAPLRERDADPLHAARSHVIRNAVEAMPDGGVLSVELHVHGAEIVLALSDTGPGISPQVDAHLFEPLHSTKPMGIGLGLVTARTFVEAHGGTIACVDVPRGARFEIRLPRRAGGGGGAAGAGGAGTAGAAGLSAPRSGGRSGGG
jgi:signal transduction histidine kinase